ncbi:MAG: hypothetical protein J6M19_02410 [Bacteroidaceae bacterium]|nr:hypothetical protein [Bacteroidaceae bacterium]
MMKKSMQWFSALALMVVSTLAFVACSSNDGDDAPPSPDNSKIVGTWVLTEVSPSDGHGPQTGTEMTFNSNGTFTSGSQDSGTYTYNSSTGAFTATMNGMTMSGNFTVSGDAISGSVNVTEGGQTQTYRMKFAKKGTEPEGPSLSSTKMVGTWKVMMDSNSDASQVGKTAVFNENGTCTWGGENYTYTCEEQEDGSLNYAIFDGNKQVTNGLLVLVNDGNVLNGNYEYAQSSIKSVVCGIVLKKPGYSYPTEGIYGRWTMTFVGQAMGDYDDYFAERLPVSSKEEVFVIDEDGGLYVEGDPHVGTYIDRTNALDFQFAGKYTARITGQITFSSGDNIINQSRGLISFGDGSSIGFRGTYQRVDSPEEGGDEVSDDRMVGTWVIRGKNGKTITFTEEGTWTSGSTSGTYTAEEDEQEPDRIKFNIYEGDTRVESGKLVLVSGGNVLNGRTDSDEPLVLEKSGYTYPNPSNSLEGRWTMTQCDMQGAPVGNVLVFGNNGELYIEGDAHIGSYSVTYTVRNQKMNADVEMTFGNGPTITGTIILNGNTASLTNATATMGGQQVNLTATLARP